MLNYGYTILRAAVARALSGSGLLPTLGIHHKNRYNAYCLADDIMEPYRPFVDSVVYEIYQDYPDEELLLPEIKQQLLRILAMDTQFRKVKRPLMVGVSQTTASLARCFKGDIKTIEYPVLP
jgi:CRISPR-associated protein Cas1